MKTLEDPKLEQDTKVLKESEEVHIITEKLTKNNGDTLIMTYQRGPLLGKGGFASVYEFTCQENKKILAGKIINKNCLQRARARQKLMFEIKIHRALHHPHIVSFERFFEDAHNIYILLELCQNQTMNELLRRRKRLTELEIQSYLAQLVSALKYLHSNRVIHRDIKLGNLFLNSKMEIKMGDFGLATKLEFEGERKRTICGTPNYIAPEILDCREGHSYEVDNWSLGVLLYTMSIGRPPFETQDVKQTYKKIKLCAYSYPQSIPISEELKDLISKLIVVEPLMRLPLDEILKHEFMQKNLIPKFLPVSTLACPPSISYLRQFTSNSSLRNSKEFRSSSLSRISDEMKSTASKEEDKSSEKYSPTVLRKQSFHKDLGQKNPFSLDVFSTNTNTNIAEKTPVREPVESTSRKIAVISNYSFTDGSAQIFVKKWVDYSSKYGLGYLLSNNYIGIYFNDSSKLICSPQGSLVHIYKPKNSGNEVSENHSLGSFPADLKKKITLLEHFRKYLVGDCCKSVESSQVYVKKWMQTEHATVFRLSDKTVQIRFLDKTELILSTELKTVAFLDKVGKCEVHPLRLAVQSDNKELSKRINYTTEMITRMMNPNK